MVRDDSRALDILAALERETDERQITVPEGVISTGLPSFNEALKIGGIPRGHITHCCGENYSGKSVAWSHVAETVTSGGGVVAIADLDRSMHMKYMRQIGINLDQVVFIRPTDIGSVTKALEHCVEKEVDLFVLDSLAAFPAIPSLDTRELGRIFDIIAGSRTATIISNQDRLTSRGMCPCYAEIMDLISPITFYLKFRHSIMEEGRIVGHNADIHIIKNRFAPSDKPVRLRLIYGKGFDKADSTIDAMMLTGSVRRSGSWYYYNEETFQGREDLRRHIEDELRALTCPQHLLQQ